MNEFIIVLQFFLDGIRRKLFRFLVVVLYRFYWIVVPEDIARVSAIMISRILTRYEGPAGLIGGRIYLMELKPGESFIILDFICIVEKQDNNVSECYNSLSGEKFSLRSDVFVNVV